MSNNKLNKLALEYATKINFHKMSLVRRYFIKQYKYEKEFESKFKTIKCPKCGSKNLFLEFDESEYSSDSWIICENCDEIIEDKYIEDMFEESRHYDFDGILFMAISEENKNSCSWRNWVEEEMKYDLGILKRKSLFQM